MIKKLLAYFMHLLTTKWFNKYLLCTNIIEDDTVEIGFNYLGEKYTHQIIISEESPESIDNMLARNTINFNKGE